MKFCDIMDSAPEITLTSRALEWREGDFAELDILSADISAAYESEDDMEYFEM